jgi:hypothetical protein
MGTKNKTFYKKPHPFVAIPDDAIVTQVELALALRKSRWSIRHMRDIGYEFQFGSTTTPGHAKRWMEANRDLLKAKSRASKEEDERRAAVLEGLK